MQTFGELKVRLTEHDLECILNTKMITANRAEELVKQQVVGDMEEEEDYINVTSLFNRVGSPVDHNSTPVVDKAEIIKRSKALSGVDRISSQPASVNVVCSVCSRVVFKRDEDDTILSTGMEVTVTIRTQNILFMSVVLYLLGADILCALIVEIIHQYRAFKYSFSGKHVVITGGSSGLGLELGKIIASEKAVVTLIARREDQLQHAKKDIEDYCRQKGVMTPHVFTEVADVCNREQLQNAMCNATNKNNAIDVIICNAGMAKTGYGSFSQCYTDTPLDKRSRTTSNPFR